MVHAWRSSARLLALMALTGCGPQAAQFVQSVTVTPNGIGDTSRVIGGNPSGHMPLLIANLVDNQSGGSIAVTVTALVLDSSGRVHARQTLAVRHVLTADAMEMFWGTFSGRWRNELVLGLWTEVESKDGLRSASQVCTPLCTNCDQTAIQQACEQLRLLAGRERPTKGPGV